MKSETPRRLTLLDVMILTAVTALGLWLSRTYYTDYSPGLPFPVDSWVPPAQPSPSPIVTVAPAISFSSSPTTSSSVGSQQTVNVAFPTTPNFADRFRYWTQCPLVVIVPALPLLVSWSLALLVLTRPCGRLSLWRAACRPEFWVGVATAIVLFLRSVSFGVHMALTRWLGGWAPEFESLTDPAWIVLLSPYPFASPTEIGWMVAIVWMTLSLSRRWRPTPGASGWIGLVLGAIWISLIPLFYIWIALFRWID